MSDSYQHVRFHPWVGSQYAAGLGGGTRVMILGESHYEWEGMPAPAEVTQHVVNQWATHEITRPLPMGVMRSFLNREPSPADKAAFWSSVLFYNYIQEFAGDRPRTRPASRMWAESEPAFFEVLEKHKPHCIAVFGHTLWSRLPNKGKEGSPLANGPESQKTWLYPTGAASHAIATYFRHPAGGLNSAKAHPWVMALLEQARVMRGNGPSGP